MMVRRPTRWALSLAMTSLLLATPASADDPAALQDQAGAAVSRGDLKAALGLLKRARQADPTNIAIHMNLGIVAAWDGQFDLATTSFSAILKAHPKHFDAQFNLGRALLAQGKTRAGYRALRTAQKLAPKGDTSPTVEIAGAQLASGDEKAAR
ncbi:MAG: Flp pilus assembly protein TadD, partial [Myxococcota bacterium]